MSTKISAADKPTGYASVNYSAPLLTDVTVKTRADLIKYAKKGGYRIYINDMIDISDGMLPSSEGGSNSKLDSFVKEKTSSKFSTYVAFRDAYAKGCSLTTDDKSSSSPSSSLGSTLWKLNSAYGNTIKITVASNTAIIGTSDKAGIKGGTIQISGANYITIRNLTLQDAYDPFPHHEKNDGYNAQWDLINIQGSCNHIWIDHCTLQDTMHCTTVRTSGTTSEKWQTYDGLLDTKGNVQYMTVSYCKFYNHDKTCLIGNSDTETVSVTRTITHSNNYYLDCGQRLPFVRNSNFHAYNNYYDTDGSKYYTQQCAIQPRSKALICAEGCYFGKGIKYSFKGDVATSKAGTVSSTKVYVSNCVDKTFGMASKQYFTISGKPFSIPYSYSLLSAEAAKTNVINNAGAGKVTL